MGSDHSAKQLKKSSNFLATAVLWFHHHIRGFEFIGIAGYAIEWVLVRASPAVPRANTPEPGEAPR